VDRHIPVSDVVLAGNEKRYVLDCLDSGWISGSGAYINAFEEQFARFCGTEYAIAVANGTVALHAALLGLGIGPGDEVIVPDLTYIASANAVTYCGATPIFADVDPVTWTLTADSVARKITPATKAVMAVHLYGHAADMAPLTDLALQRGCDVIEDAAEAHGAEYNGQRVGQLGRVATFSFYGNKIITTGEGGMITTNDRELADRMRLLRGQGMDPARRYWFPIVGYNYRMTNVQAAIGLAQLERIDWFVERRREVARWYHERLAGSSFQLATEARWAKNVYWLYSVCVPEGVDRDRLMLRMAEAGIETRPFFYPLHSLPPYHDPAGDAAFPVSTSLAARGINLPSSAALTEDDVSRVCRVLLACLHE
jgi:perosamine synthetase